MANLGDISKIKLPNGNVVNIKDATARTQANWNTNNGVKNLLNNIATSGSQKGVTYTVNADGSVSTSGTTNADYFQVVLDNFTFEQGVTYKISGCPTGGSTSGYSITNIGVMYFYDTGNGATVTGDGQTRTVMIYANSSGTNMSNLTFRPMIQVVGDSTYQPYSLPNTTITPELIELVDSGAKNLYNPPNTSTSASGLTGTITRNSDGSYTINGTTSGTVYYNMGSWITPEDGYYILSGGSAAESASQLIYDDHDWQTYESGNKKKLAYWTKGSTHNLYIRLGSGITLSNVTFYPMICSKAAWDVSQKYIPYRPTYEETVEQVNNLTPTVKDSGNAFTVGTDYTLCDACTLTVPIPSRGIKAVHIMAGLAYNSSAPRGIILSLSNNSADFNTSSKMLAKVESSDYIRLTAECFYYNYGGSNVNIYVWAKSSSSGYNRVVSSMQPMN